MAESRSYCCRCHAKKYHKYLYKLWLPFIRKNIWVCWTCYNYYDCEIQVIKPGMSTEEDRFSLNILKENQNGN